MVNLATANPVTPHRGTIALLDIDDNTVALLGDALHKGYRFKTFDAHEPLVSGLGMGSIEIDALVVGPSTEDALEVAMAALREQNNLQIIVLAELRNVEALKKRADIQFESGEGLLIWPSQHLDELPEQIRKAIKRAHRRVCRQSEDNKDENGNASDRGRSRATEHLEKILEHAPIGMLTLDDKGLVVGLNRQARLILAVGKGQLIGQDIYDFFPVFEQKKLRNILRQDEANSKQGLAQVLRVSADANAATHVEIIVAGPVDFKGEPCTMLILHDVSNIIRAEQAQKRAAAALQASEDRFHELAEVMRMVPWEANAATMRVTYMGRLAEQVLGHKRKRWLEKNFWIEQLHPDDRTETLNKMDRDIRRLQNFDLEFRMRAADGSYKWLRNIVNVVRDQNGTAEKIRGFIVDISESKQA